MTSILAFIGFSLCHGACIHALAIGVDGCGLYSLKNIIWAVVLFTLELICIDILLRS